MSTIIFSEHHFFHEQTVGGPLSGMPTCKEELIPIEIKSFCIHLFAMLNRNYPIYKTA